MITIKQFCVQKLVNNDVIANRIGTFIDDEKLLALINGVIAEVKEIDFEKLSLALARDLNMNIKNIKLNSFHINNGTSIDIYVKYDTDVYYNKDKTEWNYNQSEKCNEPGTRTRNDRFKISYDKVEDFGFDCKYE